MVLPPRDGGSRDVIHGGGADAGVHAIEAPTGCIQRGLGLHAEVHHVGQHLRPARNAPGCRWRIAYDGIYAAGAGFTTEASWPQPLAMRNSWP
jgi:hypothetical protein